MRQLYMLDPDLRVKPNQLQSAIARQVRLLEIDGVQMNSKSSLSWYVLLDKEVVADVAAKNLQGQALADELARAVRKPEDLCKLDMRRAMNLAGKAVAAATALTAVLMALNYSKLLDDVQNGMRHEVEDAQDKLLLGKFAIGGFVAEMIGQGLEKLGESQLRNMAGRAGTFAPRTLQWFGRVAGLGVGVILGLWDISKGLNARTMGDTGLSTAYFMAGGAAIGVSAMLLLAGSLGPIGWAVLAAGFVIWLGATYFIESNKNNPMQEWLWRCHFGNAPQAEKYTDSQIHIKEYRRTLPQ